MIAPVRVGQAVRLAEWAPGAPIELSEIPANSAKEFILPASETIGRYDRDGARFTMRETTPEGPRTVLLGVRPCEAAGLAIVDAVFNWDSRDEFYDARRAATTVVATACAQADADCFCTSVGGAPGATRGADVMLRLADGGRQFIVESLSARGEELLRSAHGVTEGEAAADPLADVPVRFSHERVTGWLAGQFDSPRWQEFSLACLGCAACAYLCPTCHCFDIQDESTRTAGVRYRNWDACGLGLFTQHTSGHNPRADQMARWRQRVMHKFSYYPEKFGMLACTGCGRCARMCPAGMAISDTCRAIDAEESSPG
ncbi:MAG: 4Fe-4S dicluster domain-containing protein [Phycisphaerae bacterium]|nr:4Fe-4S dicluster domain-containing protein [Phycisphaerae bacterium]